jgi:hypothetical protein
MALRCGFFIPVHGQCIVAFDTDTLGVGNTQIKLGIGLALLSARLMRLEGCKVCRLGRSHERR